MDKFNVRKISLEDSRHPDPVEPYWVGRSDDERLSAVEILRRQFAKLKPGTGYGSSDKFEEFFAAFKAHKVQYLIVGGYAFALHAHPRYAGDMDVFVPANEANAQRIEKALVEFGFSGPNQSWSNFASRGQVVQLGYPPFRIDLITEIDGVSFKNAWARRVESRYGDQPAYFISKQDLIANKRASGRKQDLLDLDALLGS